MSCCDIIQEGRAILGGSGGQGGALPCAQYAALAASRFELRRFSAFCDAVARDTI